VQGRAVHFAVEGQAPGPGAGYAVCFHGCKLRHSLVLFLSNIINKCAQAHQPILLRI
jgi:hypothetical protein